MASSQKPFYIALGVVAVAVAVFIVSRMAGPRSYSIPANVIVTAADTSGFQGYLLGSPSAPVLVTEYADYRCPHCGDFAQVQWPDVKARLVNTGKVEWRFRDFPIEGEPSLVAAHAAACANDQNKFWPVEEGLFARQTDWSLLANPVGIITDIVRNAGVNIGPWHQCMDSAKYAGRIQASLNEGNRIGVTGTPSFLIGGRIYAAPFSADEMVHVVDSLIAVKSPDARPPSAPVQPGPPLETTGGQ